MFRSKTIFTAMATTVFASLLAFGGFTAATAGTKPSATTQATKEITGSAPIQLMHVHGLAYSVDGKQLLIPSHHGIAVYSDGQWSKMAGPEHDYMGFSATRGAFYSSGQDRKSTRLNSSH